MKRSDADKKPSPYGWEMAFAWCPPEDSPLLGGSSEQPDQGQLPDPPDEQAAVTRRYDRMAWLYDICDAPMEWMGTRRRRRRLLSKAEGRVLEVGVGTGKNLTHYPKGVTLTGIDISEAMLARARRRAGRLGRNGDFEVADAHQLPFPDATFDTTVATCVFCSVADPVRGLSELARVTRPGGRILLLEHVRPRNRLLGWLADAATVLTHRIFGFRANRRTEDNVADAGLHIVDIRREGVWREIGATPGAAPTRRMAPRDESWETPDYDRSAYAEPNPASLASAGASHVGCDRRISGALACASERGDGDPGRGSGSRGTPRGLSRHLSALSPHQSPHRQNDRPADPPARRPSGPQGPARRHDI